MGYILGDRVGITLGQGKYREVSDEGVDVYTDGTYYYRKQVRNGALNLDKALTVTGFSGSENTDWINIKSLS